MKVVKDFNLRNDTWAGGHDSVKIFDKNGDLDEVENILEQIFEGQIPTDTEVNDCLWFETDTICQFLGYEDSEDYMQHNEEA